VRDPRRSGVRAAQAPASAITGASGNRRSDPLKGQIPRGFVVLKAGDDTNPDTLRAELIDLVRNQIGAVASLRRVDIITGLPKTRSGKILRKTMRGIADGNDEPIPSTIDDPAALDALRPILWSGG